MSDSLIPMIITAILGSDVIARYARRYLRKGARKLIDRVIGLVNWSEEHQIPLEDIVLSAVKNAASELNVKIDERQVKQIVGQVLLRAELARLGEAGAAAEARARAKGWDKPGK